MNAVNIFVKLIRDQLMYKFIHLTIDPRVHMKIVCIQLFCL